MTAMPRGRASVDDRRQVGGLAEQVHRHDRLGPRRDRRDRGAGVDVERAGLDVDEHRRRAERATTQPAVAKNEYVRRDHLVAGADAERHQRRQQRVGARRHADGVRHVEVARTARARGLRLRDRR